MDEIKICWHNDPGINAGNAYGYYVHNGKLKEAVSKIAELDEKADDVFMILPPEAYKAPVKGKTNWLFTMTETSTILDEYKRNVEKADFLFVPSNWVKEQFGTFFDPDKIFVVNHGVDSVFRYKKRTYSPRKKFRYLWIGAPNPRKGFVEMGLVWDRMGFKRDRKAELYVKTTLVEGVKRNDNVVLDGRNLSDQEMVELYHSAHCFLFPTRGEGFGLTLAEAMRTGLPCIATNYSGVTDFFDQTVGFPLPYELKPLAVKSVLEQKEYEGIVAFSDVKELYKKMLWVRANYRKAVKLGHKASVRIMTNFTWEQAARKLVNFIAQHGGGKDGHSNRRGRERGTTRSREHRVRRIVLDSD